MRRKIVVFHPGTQHVKHLVHFLQEKGFDFTFYTEVSKSSEKDYLNLWLRYLPKRLYNIDSNRLVSVFGLEILEILANRFGMTSISRELNDIGNKYFQSKIESEINKSDSILWGFNTSSYHVFEKANANSFKILEQTIGHPERYNELMLAEQSHYKKGQIKLKSARSIEIANIEINSADAVIVGSSFCKDTINPLLHNKIHVVAYPSNFKNEYIRNLKSLPRRITFLFVGQVSPRKGVAHIVKTAKLFPQHNFILAGPVMCDLGSVPANVHLKGPVNRNQLVDLYREANCFLFPSIYEGSALVLREAKAFGLPIIQSRNAGDGVKHMVDGIVLEKINEFEISRAIEMLLENNFYLLKNFSNSKVVDDRLDYYKFIEKLLL
jgi:glycosyltransferase involved in cell wall biosynthesis